ncbi:MAG: glycosyltransferase [Patescibacteria group bacterium]|nr:glycosyltransferase [Patescibacteria group bacterium]
MISIIIPTRNEEKGIRETVVQFKNLTLPHEIIVSDTLSTDNTVAIAKECADKVLVLSPDEKASVSKGRNNGAREARGEFLVFLDSETYIPNPQAFFTRALARFNADLRLAGISGRIEIDPRVRTWSDWFILIVTNLYFLTLNNIVGIGAAAGKFQMIRTNIFRETGGFNEQLFAAEDIELFQRLAKQGHTRIAWDLVVYHPGRRFHQLGAWNTVFRWMKNIISFWIRKKPADKEWEEIR